MMSSNSDWMKIVNLMCIYSLLKVLTPKRIGNNVLKKTVHSEFNGRM